MTNVINAYGVSDLWPTPPPLASKMVSRIKKFEGRYKHDLNILEPSAGKGDLIEALNADSRYDNNLYSKISAIEIYPDLIATLLGKGIKVIDSDFLTFAGPDKFDLIIMNPPFRDGDKHLLKAIDIMYRGQIICLLNAETLRNPYTNTRKMLVDKLKELGAEIEYIAGGFRDAERRTDVEVALIDIKIHRKLEDDLFKGCDDEAEKFSDTVEEKHEVSTGKKIPELVAEYNQIIAKCTETFLDYFKNYRKVGKYIWLNKEPERYRTGSPGDMTALMQRHVNEMLVAVRKDFWREALELPEVRKRLTSKKRDEFNAKLEQCEKMDFTEGNIRNFVLNLICTYEETLTQAVVDIFDMFTRHGYNDQNAYEKNIHYFNGWKTNDAFKINKKVVIPMGWQSTDGSGPFTDWNGEWRLKTYDDVTRKLHDIDTVMCYFDGMDSYLSMTDVITRELAAGRSSGIESTYFKITCHKKGTIHLTFQSEDILRRFNVVACKGKGWLPCDYGAKPFMELTHEEKSVTEAFEGKTSYEQNVKRPLFAPKGDQFKIEYEEKPTGQMELFKKVA